MKTEALLVTTLLLAGCARVAAPAPGTLPTPPAARSYAVRMAEAVMARHPQVNHRWDYIAGLVLLGIDDVGRRNGDARYAAYVQRNMDQWVQPDGSITGYRLEDFNIDQVNQGKLLFRLHERTGDNRYRAAAQRLRQQMRQQPRTSEGGFWHKQVYPHQMWLDGLYMASPFLAEFANVFAEPSLHDDVALQILLVARHTRDARTGLHYHGWDESRTQSWADPETGLSRNFWGRAMGWYAMALVDVLDHMPATHPQHAGVVSVLQSVAEAVADVQDPVTGLWYQVMDQPSRAGNYLEASASSMFAYALAKGARQGHLDPRYRTVAERAFDGIVQRFIRVDEDGHLTMDGINEVSGLGGPRERSGSFEYYMSEPVVSNDYKGVGPFILAALELNR